MALPEFQRGYVWNRDQVRGLMDSLYRRHPIGSLLVWVTESVGAPSRGDGAVAPGVVKLLLDGQQRITTLYGITRAKPPEFFDGEASTFTGLRFHLEREEFSFYMPTVMKDDPLWIDISALMKKGNDGLGEIYAQFSANPELAPRIGEYAGRLTKILGIRDVELHIEEVTGSDKNIDVVVEIFNRVNSGGTKLSKGDLALAKICAGWPEARDRMKATLAEWKEQGYDFEMDWLLRCMNTVVTGEAKFLHLHDVGADRIEEGLNRAGSAIEKLLNLVAGRLGLDHDRVLFGQYAFPVMVHYLDRKGGKFDDAGEQDRLLFWYLQSALWGRFSGSTESFLDKDLHAIEKMEGGLGRLLEQLRLWRGSLRVEPDHFGGWSIGARFYPMLYLMTRMGEARDWSNGQPLKSHMLGKMSKLEVHHIFPKAVLYKHDYERAEVNAVANYAFLTKDANLAILDAPPEVYFPQVEEKFPGALASQWIPMDPELWKVENYGAFMAARRALLAKAANAILEELFHGPLPEEPKEEAPAEAIAPEPAPALAPVPGGVDSDEEDRALHELNEWVVKQGLPEGDYLYDLADYDTGLSLAVLDLAWPVGLQRGLSTPVAVLLNEPPETFVAAGSQHFRCFSSIEGFKEYVEKVVLGRGEQEGVG